MQPKTNHTLILVLMLSAAGCAPRGFTEGVGFAADQYRVRDAATLTVSGKGYLRFNTALRSDLEDAITVTDLSEVRERGAEVLRQANALAVTSVSGEIDRMSKPGVEFLIRTYRLENAPEEIDDRRQYLKREFDCRAHTAVDQDLVTLSAAPDLRTARRFLSDIEKRTEPAAGDRGKAARMLLGAALFLPASIGAEIADQQATQREMVADFRHVAEYHPAAEAEKALSAEALAKADRSALARWFAPVLIQQVDTAASYPAEADRIGRVYLEGTKEAIRVHVDTADPVVYWTALEAKVGDRKYDQLVYAAWYPFRPSLKSNDPEAGRIDGVVLRITLDRHERPAVYEFVRSCGCYHTLWVSEFVEAAARQQYGPPSADRRFAVERAVKGAELFVPDLVRDDGAHPRRPVAFVSAGHHLLMSIRPAEEGAVQGEVVARSTYRLEPYETLTRLPLGDGVASMFGSDGLVHDAGRGEGWLLAPTGMLSAGQPRQLGTMKIRMDAYDYDDPRLLDRNLRLPREF